VNQIAYTALKAMSGTMSTMAETPEGISQEFITGFLTKANNVLLEIIRSGGNPDEDTMVKLFDSLNEEVVEEAIRYGFEKDHQYGRS